VTEALEQQQQAMEAQRAFLRSEAFQQINAQMLQLLAQLPELALRFKELDPFYGSSAQVCIGL
jgi:hypothetical protein